LSVTIDQNSAHSNGFTGLPEGFVLGHINLPSSGLTVSSIQWQSRKNGATTLTDYGAAYRGAVGSPGSSTVQTITFFSVAWTWTGPPDTIATDDTVQFRVHVTYSDASTEDSAWSTAEPYIPCAATLALNPGGGLTSDQDDILRQILAAVKHTFYT
jgi:hypothetical protein